jgi:hypothetical protein
LVEEHGAEVSERQVCRYAPSFGAGLPRGERFAGGTADSNACLTARR